MNDANLVMANSKGISEEKIQELHRERKRKEAEKRKSMGCWDCGKKLTTWDYPLGVAHIGTNVKLGLMKKKVAGEAYLCHSCQLKAKQAADEIEEEGACWICGQPGTPRACGVHLCEKCTSPKDITDITSQHGDGSMVEDRTEIELVRDWWFSGRGLLSCLMELEMFQRTENVKRLKQLRSEIAEEKKIGIITDSDHENILALLDDVIAEVAKDEGEPVEMAAGLYGTIEGLMMKTLYHHHPLKEAANIQLEPGDYDLIGADITFAFTVSEAPVILRRLKDEAETEEEAADEEEAEEKKDD